MLKNGYFKSFDGTKLFYSIEEASGPALLFCYGIVCSKQHWAYQMEYFRKKNYTIIWFDYRGHHNSDFPKDPRSLTLDSISKDALLLLDELKIHEFIALGHSMGVNVVLDIYRKAPEKIKAMILANGSARAPLETLLKSNFFQTALPYINKAYEKYPTIVKWLWAAQGKSKIAPWLVGLLGFNPTLAKPEDISHYVQSLSKLDMIVLLQLLKDYDHYDASPWLHQIDIPTLILAGENDLVIPKEQQEIMHQLIPNSGFQVIRNGSHCPQMDIPDLVNMMIDRFFNEKFTRRRTADLLQSVLT